MQIQYNRLWPFFLIQTFDKTNSRQFSFCLFFSTGGDDFLVVQSRDDFGTLHGTTPYTHSSPGTPINMPWLGGVQTGRGAAVVSLPPLRLPSGAVDVCSLSVFFSSAVTL